jgi:hypothetical protein
VIGAGRQARGSLRKEPMMEDTVAEGFQNWWNVVNRAGVERCYEIGHR